MKKPPKNVEKFWDKVLLDHRLGMGRGTSSLVDYRGTAADLDGVQNQQIFKRSGRTRKKANAE